MLGKYKLRVQAKSVNTVSTTRGYLNVTEISLHRSCGWNAPTNGQLLNKKKQLLSSSKQMTIHVYVTHQRQIQPPETVNARLLI